MRRPRWNPPVWLSTAWRYVLPFLGIMAVVAIFTAMFVIVLTSFDAQREAKSAARVAVTTGERAAKTAELARIAALEARAISLGNRTILDKLEPCLPGDAPELPRCIRQAQGAAILQGALASVQAQHDEQDAKLNSLLGRPAVRNLRPSPTPARAPQAGGSPPSPAAPHSSTAPTPTVQPPTTVAPRPPPATTTTCPKRGSSNNCR